jgi:hypothetical protein
MPTCTTRLYLRAAASIACPSTTSTLIGFCTHTSSPPAGLDHRQRMPVIGRPDQTMSRSRGLQHLAPVAVRARRFFDCCRVATSRARSDSMRVSTSQSDTTSTGAT